MIGVVGKKSERRRFKGFTVPSTIVKGRYWDGCEDLPDTAHDRTIVYAAATDDDFIHFTG